MFLSSSSLLLFPPMSEFDQSFMSHCAVAGPFPTALPNQRSGMREQQGIKEDYLDSSGFPQTWQETLGQGCPRDSVWYCNKPSSHAGRKVPRDTNACCGEGTQSLFWIKTTGRKSGKLGARAQQMRNKAGWFEGVLHGCLGNCGNYPASCLSLFVSLFLSLSASQDPPLSLGIAHVT